MRKIAVVTDSNSGIASEEAERLNIRVVPMPFMMDGETFFEGINLTYDMFFKKMAENSDISTSQPSAGSVMDIWNELLKEYDEVVHIPMSSGLSAAYSTAAALSAEYGGRVQAIDNRRISVTMRQSVLDAVELAENGKTAAEIKQTLENTADDSSIYLMVDTLAYLKKGGRITSAAAAIGTILNIKPVLQIHGDKIDSYAKARGAKQARKIMIDAMKNDFAERFNGFATPDKMWLQVAYSYGAEGNEEFKQEVEEAFPGFVTHMGCLALSVSCHVGPGSLAIACSKKL